MKRFQTTDTRTKWLNVKVLNHKLKAGQYSYDFFRLRISCFGIKFQTIFSLNLVGYSPSSFRFGLKSKNFVQILCKKSPVFFILTNT